MTIAQSQEKPPFMRQSRAKLWIRTGILAVFGTLFGLTLYRDMGAGLFPGLWALIIFLLCLPVGFWMRRLVPMKIHPASQHVTLSFDRIYFSIIVFLVLVKMVAGFFPSVSIVADVVMCMILGLMIGRLSGVCLRVHDLKQGITKPG